MRNITLREDLAASLNLLPAAIYDAFPAVLFGRLLVIVTRLGIFDVLHERPRTAEEVASALHMPLKSADLLLRSLEAGGYLRIKDQRYTLAPQARKWLVSSSPHSLNNFLRYIELLHTHWMQLEKTLLAGAPPKTYFETFTPEEWAIYTDGMRDLARLILPTLLPHVELPRGASQLLDLGGSHGLYSLELCRQHPELRATIADTPAVIAWAERGIEDHPLKKQIDFLAVDLACDSFGVERYDAVLAFNIVHGFTEEGNRSIIARAATALRTGGKIFIMDQFAGSGKRRRGVAGLLPLMVGVNLLNEIGGNVYSVAGGRQWCRDAGLGQIEHTHLSLPGVSLITAGK